MQSIIAKLFKPTGATPLSTMAGVNFSSGPCSSCETDCSIHEQLPTTMQKRIDQGPLLGTFKPYLYHILIRSGKQDKWPEKVEEEKKVEAYVTRLKASKKRVMVTLFDEDASNGSMYIFPSGYQINEQNEEGQTAEKITNWILKQQHDHSDVASFDSSIAESIPESINAFVLVCAHMKRDKKCGIAGPMLIKAFKKELEDRKLGKSVPVLGISHIGGHKFAGNVIIYSRNGENKGWISDWYGRVKTCHVASLVQECIEGGKVIEELWRGRMGDPSDPSIEW